MNVGNEKLKKLDLSSSFGSEDLEEVLDLPLADLESMIDLLHATLVKSKLLPKDFPKPNIDFEGLKFLIITLCDEFLLEVDVPIMTTHCTSGNQLVVEEVKEEKEKTDPDEDFLSKIFNAKSSVSLSEKDCKDLCAVIISFARKSKSGNFKSQKKKLEEKIIAYQEELIRNRRLLKAREFEVNELQKQIKMLITDRDSLEKTGTTESLNWRRSDLSTENYDF